MSLDINKVEKCLAGVISEGSVEKDVPMSQYTSFRAGGNAAMMATPQSIEELTGVLRVLNENGYRHMVIGNGSNLLVKDSGYDGVIIRIGSGMDHIEQVGEKLICGSGALMSSVAKAAAAGCLTGFEFASGIPGSIGGAVFMNAGAYGGEISQILKRARVVSADGTREFYMTAGELNMGYRHTVLHETGDIVVEAELGLKGGAPADIRKTMAELAERRNAKQPVSFPSAGSFFKRPEGYFAGKLIQDAGLKGLSVGGAQVSELHSGFIINRGGATATDILQLMEIVQARVFDEFGVRLEAEVRIIG